MTQVSTPSRERPRVNNDNLYPEPLFRTLKYCRQWPRDGFADLNIARLAAGYRAEDHEVLCRRHELYQQVPLDKRDAQLVAHRRRYTHLIEGAVDTEDGGIIKMADATTISQTPHELI